MTAPSINVAPAGAAATASSTTTIGRLISAVPQDDIIVVTTNAETTSGSFSVLSVTGTGLTFVQRSSEYVTGSSGGTSKQGTEVWWALVPSGGFTGTVTATFSTTIDDATFHIFSVIGADTSDPWNGVSATTAGNGTSTASPVETTFSAPSGTLVILAGSNAANAFFTSPVTGFTNLSQGTNGGGVNHENSAVATQALTSAMSGATVGWTNSDPFWTLIADAMVPPGPPSRFVLDTASASDSVSVSVTAARSTTDAATVSASTSASTAALIARSTSDTASASDAVTTAVSRDIVLDGGISYRTHTATVDLGIKVITKVDTAWMANNRQRDAAVTIDIGDTTDDGLDFDDPADDYDNPPTGSAELFALPPNQQAAALRELLYSTTEPAARSIRQQWFDITAGPTLDANGQPDPTSWTFTRHSKTWGHYRIKVGTKNVTTFRGAHTILLQLSDTEPFGDDTCQIYFPAIGPFEPFGVGDLYWLPSTDTDAHIPIDIKHIHPDGTVAVHFEGQIQSLNETLEAPQPGTGNRTGLIINGLGIVKCYDQRITKPRFNSDPIDIGRLIHRWTKYEVKYGFHGHPCPAADTDILTAERGSYGDPLMTTTIQSLLSTAQTGEGTQWTITNHRPRGLHLVTKDLTTVDFTLWCGQPGVTHQFTRDLTHAYRAIFGEGQDKQVQWWRGTVYPNAYINPPDFPHTFTPGGSATGFDPFSDELKSRGYNLDSNDTYLASDENTIKAFQDDAGLTEDGDVGAQTWNTAFQDGEDADVLQAFYRPLAVGPHAEPFLYNGRGGIIGRNPQFDHRTRREKLEQFGPTSKADARESAKREIEIVYHADYAGTITLTNVDPPEMSALSVRNGMNCMFKGHHGFDRLMHVAKVDRQPGMDPRQNDRVVTLTTSERGDDYVTLAARLQRHHDVVDTSGRVKPPRRSSKRSPDFAPFDAESGAGYLTPHAQAAGLWNIYPIPAGELGTIVHIRLTADTDTLIAAAIFNRRVTPRQLVRLPGLADPSSGAAGGQDPWTVNAKKLTRNLKFRDQPWMAWATGGPGAMQGYWPNEPTDDESKVTGVLDDSSPWNYHSAKPPWLWLAVWTRDDCKISGDPNYDHRALFPGPPQ